EYYKHSPVSQDAMHAASALYGVESQLARLQFGIGDPKGATHAIMDLIGLQPADARPAPHQPHPDERLAPRQPRPEEPKGKTLKQYLEETHQTLDALKEAVANNNDWAVHAVAKNLLEANGLPYPNSND